MGGHKRRRPQLFSAPIIEIDDSALEEDEREFLQRWANALQVLVAVFDHPHLVSGYRRRSIHREASRRLVT